MLERSARAAAGLPKVLPRAAWHAKQGHGSTTEKRAPVSPGDPVPGPLGFGPSRRGGRAAVLGGWVEVSPEAAARGLVYSGLGLSVDGNGEAASPVTELVAAVRAVVDHGMKQPIGAPEAKPKLIEMAEALIRLERSLKR